MIPSVDIAMVLAPGDRMELKEFLERWDQLPELKFAELIDGVVYMPSPLSIPDSRFHGLADLVLSHYAALSGLCENLPDATWLILESAPQPDLALHLSPEYGGTMKIDPLKLAAGVPELAVEVCKSSRAYDLGPKLSLYERGCTRISGDPGRREALRMASFGPGPLPVPPAGRRRFPLPHIPGVVDRGGSFLECG